MKDSEKHKVLEVDTDDHDYEIVLEKFKDGITKDQGILSNRYSTVADVKVKSVSLSVTCNTFKV